MDIGSNDFPTTAHQMLTTLFQTLCGTNRQPIDVLGMVKEENYDNVKSVISSLIPAALPYLQKLHDDVLSSYLNEVQIQEDMVNLSNQLTLAYKEFNKPR